MSDNVGLSMQGSLLAAFLRGVDDLQICSPTDHTEPHLRILAFTKNEIKFVGSFNMVKNTGFVIERSQLHKL